MRIHELAKDLDMSSKDLMSELHDLGIDAKNHMCALSPEQVEEIREALFGDMDIRPAAKQQAAEPAAEIQPPPDAMEPAPADAAAAEPPPSTEPDEVTQENEPEPSSKIIVQGPVIVKDFAPMLNMKPNVLIAELMTMNVFASINQKLDIKIAQRVAEKHGMELELEKKKPEPPPPPPAPVAATTEEPLRKKKKKKKKKKDMAAEDHPEELISRPPVVTFLGHVDHGKTSLLDRIRHARVAAGEDGGITQHIGAYSVEYQDQQITFLDTPGHAAFTAMRARGANLTDIAVLVVAADDGIMPQTREAIQHALAAEVCVVVAVNKIDLPGANPDRVLQQLQQEGLAPEEWGGDVGVCQVSAATGEGLDELLERLLLESEMLELQARPSAPGNGYVIEARMEPGRGPTASMLVTEGTLKVGDAVVCGNAWGRIKALINDKGKMVRTAGPSSAVKCMGLNSVPEAGDEFNVYADDTQARAVAESRQADQRQADLNVSRKVSLDDLLSQTAPDQKSELHIVLKADVKGSLEAIIQSLDDINSEKVSINFVLTGVGNITDNDVLLASASNAIIIGFHVSLDTGVEKTAKHEGVEVRLYSVIYELLDDVREAMTGMLEPILRENVTGHAEIRQVFSISKYGNVAGCMVKDGRITAKGRARLQRNGETIFAGAIASLKRFQNDAAEIREGQECGIRLGQFSDYKPGDIIECYEVQKIAQQL
jgi:translation initiation factor IF-2